MGSLFPSFQWEELSFFVFYLMVLIAPSFFKVYNWVTVLFVLFFLSSLFSFYKCTQKLNYYQWTSPLVSLVFLSVHQV